MAAIILHFAHLFGQKAQPKVKTTEKTESRSILLHANGRFIGVLELSQDKQ